MKSLEIGRYTKLLITQGTVWENGSMGNSGIQPATGVAVISMKRIVLFLLAATLSAMLKCGFNKDFCGFLISGLSIFIGLFINIIVVLYQRFIALQEFTQIAPPNRNNRLVITGKLNFIRQFTFVTGKNLLISTLLIMGCTLSLLFPDAFSTDVGQYYLIKEPAKWELTNYLLAIEVGGLFAFRIALCYLMLDFFLLLMYSIGSLFAFLKGEY